MVDEVIPSVNVKLSLAAVLLGVTLVLVVAAPASAHATLVQSDPAPCAVLAPSPSTITLRFDERVSAGLGAARVYDRRGSRSDPGDTDGQESQCRLRLSQV